MVYVSIGALAVCALMFFIAAEAAGGVRQGRRASMLYVVLAAIAFLVAAPLLVRFAPSEGFERFVILAVAGITGISCFWFTKTHVEHQRPVGGLVAATLGLVMFAVAFVVWFGKPQPPVVDPTDATAQTVGNQTGVQLERLEERRVALESRLLSGIPEFRRSLMSDAAEVRRELVTAGAGAAVRLDAELRDIAKLLLALDAEETETRDLISRIKQEQRRLERLRNSQQYLDSDDALIAELDQIWQEAGAKLAIPIESKVGSGAIEEAQLQQKLNELQGG